MANLKTLNDIITKFLQTDRLYNKKSDSIDIEIIEEARIDDFYNLFKSIKDDHLYYYVMKCLDYETKARDALNKIADESELNKLRMAKFQTKFKPT